MNVRGGIASHDFILVCLVGFLTTFGSSAAEAVVPLYAQDLGGAAGAIGLVGSFRSISALIVLPFSAPVIDAFPKTRTLTMTGVVFAGAIAGFACSDSIEMLLFFRLVHGIGLGVNFAVCLALASDVLVPEFRTQGIVIFTLAQSVATAFAPAVGMWLVASAGYVVTFLVGAALIGAASMLVCAVRTPVVGSGKIEVRLDTMVAPQSMRPAALMGFLSMAYSTVNSFVAVYATDIGVDGIGAYFTVYSLMLLISRPAMTRLSGRVSKRGIMLPSLGCFALSLVLVASANDLLTFLLAAAVAAFGYGVCQPLVQAMCVEQAGKGRSGVGSTTSYIGTNVGYLIGPGLGGAVAEAVGYRIMYLTAMVPLAMGALMVLTDQSKDPF